MNDDAVVLTQDESGQHITNVPPKECDMLQAHLEKQGIHTTSCQDPSQQSASLEVWPGPAAEEVRVALETWGGATRPVTAPPAAV
jgi:hypothetical protein